MFADRTNWTNLKELKVYVEGAEAVNMLLCGAGAPEDPYVDFVCEKNAMVRVEYTDAAERAVDGGRVPPGLLEEKLREIVTDSNITKDFLATTLLLPQLDNTKSRLCLDLTVTCRVKAFNMLGIVRCFPEYQNIY